MNFLKRFLPLVLGLALIAGVTFAQTQQSKSDSVTDHELNEFAKVASSGQSLQMNAQKKFAALIKEEGLNPRRFQMLMQSKQNPSMADTMNITDDEKAAMDDIQPKMAKMNQDLQKKVASLIKDSELSQQRFQQIAQKLQTDKSMAKRYQKILMKLNGQGGGNS